MIISVASGKGGTGKTTVATNLALSIGSDVQLLDCDVEQPNAHLFLQPYFDLTETVTTPVPDQGADGLPDGYSVVYASPSQGVMEFDWHGPLVIDGLEVPLHDYPRYDNPFVQLARNRMAAAVIENDGRRKGLLKG